MASNDLSAMLSQLASFFFVLSRLGPTGSSHRLWHLLCFSPKLASLCFTLIFLAVAQSASRRRDFS